MEKLDNISEVERFLAFLATSHQGSSQVEGAAGYSELLEKETDEPAAIFKSLRSLTKTLQDLMRIAEKELEVTKERLLPEIYREGLYSLPFEVFARILELAYGPENGSSRREEALWVNHYFRDAMLNVSKLWTAVDLGNLDPLLVASSRSQPLSVSMEFFKISDDRYQRSFEALRPEAWRWKSMTVVGHSLEESIDFRNGTTHARLKQLRDTFQGVTFPALESLNVDYDRDYAVDEEGIVLSGQNDPNTTIRNFFSSWNMPALRNLTAIGFVPTLPSSCQSALTNLQLTLHGGEYMFDLRAVINALRPLISLRRLSFDIMVEDWMVNEMQAVTLPGLKSLSIESVASRGEEIGMLLDLIGTPNLRELDIKAEVYSCAEGVTYLDAFFPSDVPRWAELESISCFLEVADERNSHLTGNPPFEVLCTRLPRLRHLTLGTGTTAQPSDLLLHEHFRLPSSNRRVTLTTLRIVDCPFFDTSFIISLGSIINARQFESLEIHRCPKISIEAMRTLLPSSKQFIWSPYNWNHDRRLFMPTRCATPFR